MITPIFKIIPNGQISNNSLSFNTSLDYIPALLIPKFKIVSSHPMLSSGSFNIKGWDLKKRNEVFAKYSNLRYNHQTQGLGKLFHSHLCVKVVNGNSIIESLKTTKEDILNIIDNTIYGISDTVNVIDYFGNRPSTELLGYFKNHYNYDQLSNLTYGSGPNKTTCLVSSEFVADNYNNVNCDISYVLMIKKEYIAEYILSSLLGKPINKSNFQWWVDSRNTTRLNEFKKRSYNQFVKHIKETDIEIIAKENLNNLILNFESPKISSISEIRDFNQKLNLHVKNFMYNSEEKLPELDLKISKEVIKTVPLKGIKIKKVEPQLVD